jgi:hypothetical protein
MAKPSARQKANQFLSQIGTAGGPVGAMTAPQLVSYGAGDLINQVQSGMIDEYARQRSQGLNPAVGAPDQAEPPITSNLAADYLNLSLPGSPLPMHGLMGAHNLKAAQVTQDHITAMQQQYVSQMMPQTGVLPLSPLQLAKKTAKKVQNKTSNRGER